jgi:hypothetical protein
LSDEKYATEKTEDVDPDDYEKLEEGIMQYGYVFFFLFSGYAFLISSLSANKFVLNVLCQVCTLSKKVPHSSSMLQRDF